MASPFNVFRRNQRVMMAVLTGLSMFAFLFFDVTTMRSGGLPKSMTVIFFAAICALGLWFVGRRHGKASEWALWGALLGGFAAFLFVRNSAPPPAVRTKAGDFTEADLRELGQKRYQANQFAFRAAQMSKSQRGTQGFGPSDDRTMLQFALGRAEAKRLGISLNDDAVNRYINEITDDKLSQSDFHKILKEINLSAGDLFNLLRGELEVRLALETQAPPYDMWMDFDLRSGQTFFRPKMPATPQEQWEFFQKLNVKESLSVVALPVEEFLPKVPEPTKEELKDLFEAGKKRTPGPLGEPGFIQPHRVKLAYLAASFEKFESQAKPPTDEEISEFYEQNKVRYQIRDFPELPADDDSPADAAAPANVAPELPAPDTEPKSEATPDEKPATEKPEEKGEKPEEKSDKPKEGESSAALDANPLDQQPSGVIRLVSAVSVESAEKTEDKPAAEAKTDEPADEPLDAAMEDESDEFPVELPSPGAAKTKPEIRYRPLDDDLREQIRREIVQDRAFEKMGEAIEKAKTEMEGMAFQYLEAEEDARAGIAERIAEKLKAYAVDHSLEYVETPRVSETELKASTSDSIGAAVLPTAGGMAFQSVPVVSDVFPPNGQVGPLYFPQRADSRLRDKRFAWWKIEDKPQHEPEWDDAGIQDQVRTAWKYENGRKLAQQRAAQLLELAKADGKKLAEALAGQTVTGEAGTESIVIKETGRFSWLTTSTSAPFDPELGDFLAPRRSFIDGVDQPGDDFMKAVFEDLKNGETGIVANAQRSVFYVVQVQDRDGTTPAPDVEGFQTVENLRDQFAAFLGAERREFAARPYNLMMTNAFSRVQQEWTKSFDQRYGVEMEVLPDGSPASGRKSRK